MSKRNPDRVVREIQRKTRRRFSAEEKIRIVLEGLKGEDTIAGLCRRKGITTNVYHGRHKEILTTYRRPGHGKECCGRAVR